MINYAPRLLKINVYLIIGLLFCSCSKKKDLLEEVEFQQKYNTTINGREYNLSTDKVTTTYYSTEGEHTKSLLTSAVLNTEGDEFTFFIGDFKEGNVTITKKNGTSFRPYKPDKGISAVGQAAGTQTYASIQSYVRFSSGGNKYYATSGTISAKISNGITTINWDADFEDAAGKKFSSNGSFMSNNITQNTKPTSEILDPTPLIPNPVIESISPVVGKAGDTVTISGVNFGMVKTDLSVKFNETAAVIVSNSDTSVKVITPNNGTSGYISLKVKEQQTIIGPIFTYQQPITISYLSPAEGRPGDTITVHGNNFSTDVGNNKVTFASNVNAQVISSTNKQLVFIVPDEAKTGTIHLIVNGLNTQINNFVINAPYPIVNWKEVYSFTSSRSIHLMTVSEGAVLLAPATYSEYLYYSANGSNFINVYNALPFNKQIPIEINSLQSINGTFYVTTDLGIAKSTNGTLWTKLDIDPTVPNLGFTNLAIIDANTLYTVSGSSLYKSRDAGATWTKTTSNTGANLGYLTHFPASDKYLFAVDIDRHTDDYDATKIYKTTVAFELGKTWSTSSGRTGIYPIHRGRKDFFASGSEKLYSVFTPADQPTEPNFVYSSSDHGDTWQRVTPNRYGVNAMKAKNRCMIYGDHFLNVTTNDGTSFKSYNIPQGFYIGGLEIVDDTLFYILCANGDGLVKIFKSR